MDNTIEATPDTATVTLPVMTSGVIKVLPKKSRTDTLAWYLADFSSYCQRNWHDANSRYDKAQLRYETLSETAHQDWMNWFTTSMKKDDFSGALLPVLDTEEPLAASLRELLEAHLICSSCKKDLEDRRKFFRLCNDLLPAHETGLQKWEIRAELKAWIQESPYVGELGPKLKNSKVTVANLLNCLWSGREISQGS